MNRRRFLAIGLAAAGEALLPVSIRPPLAQGPWSGLALDTRTTYEIAVGGDRVDVFNATTGSWSTARLSVGRSYMTSASVGSRALFFSGVSGCNSCPAEDLGGLVVVYDPSAA